jgi:Zyg-11 family protein
MLNLIRIRLAENMCDDVMEMAWSSMWNVTDETPENCRKFLDSGGMNAFLDCCKVSRLRFKRYTDAILFPTCRSS